MFTSAGLIRYLNHDDIDFCRQASADRPSVASRRGALRPTSDFLAIADRFEIEALRGEFTDAGMMRDYDRFASLFTKDGAWRMPHINGSSHLNYSVYHDRYQRTSDGWKFTERVYEVRYLDSTPLADSAPHAAGGAR
jgi:hypothetical protein